MKNATVEISLMIMAINAKIFLQKENFKSRIQSKVLSNPSPVFTIYICHKPIYENKQIFKWIIANSTTGISKRIFLFLKVAHSDQRSQVMETFVMV
jgi:hypothetical protein